MFVFTGFGDKMELKDLMVLADTDKEAACSTFDQIYGSTRISFLNLLYYKKNGIGYVIKPNNQHIVIETYDFLTQFLHKFGHLVKDLRISGSEESSFRWTDVFIMVATHCTSIKKLYLCNDIETDPTELSYRETSFVELMLNNPLQLRLPCPTLEILEIESIFLDVRSKIDVYFPNLRSLDLQKFAASDVTFIEVNQPELGHLAITLTDEYYHGEDDSRYQMNRSNVKNALGLNPQLRSVSLELKMDLAFVEFMNESLPNLQEISLTLWFEDLTDKIERFVKFRNIIKANLKDLDRLAPPIRFSNLRELDIACESDWTSINFIKRNQSLITLTMACSHYFKQAFHLIRALPNLQNLHLTVDRYKWRAGGVIRFLAECERLNQLTLTVSLDKDSHETSWRPLISNIWKIKKEPGKLYTIQKVDCDTQYVESDQS